MDENRSFKALEDRIACAVEFKASMFAYLVRELDEKHLVINTIKKFLRMFVDNFRTPSYERSFDSYIDPFTLFRARMYQAEKDREFLHSSRN
jgi:hypothetical protein